MPVAEDVRQELEWRRCRKDIRHFARAYFKIQHPERGAILFELREAQDQTLAVWMKERLSIVLKARQVGFSTLGAMYAAWLVLFHPDRLIIMLSRTERDAHKLLGKVKYGLQRLPPWMQARLPAQTIDTQAKIAFVNGSSIESLPATDPARGESAYLIFVDEWAFFPDPEAAWAAIEPAADIGGRIITLSTANGSGNLFHQMWVKARAGIWNATPIFFSWRAGGRDDAWYAVKKASLLEWQLHQEYPDNENEAFIRSGNPVFNIDQLDAMPTERPARGYLAPRDGSANASEFIVNDDGPLRVFELPQPRIAYCIGADVAEGLEHGDFSSAHVINTMTGKVVAKWHGHVDPDVFGAEVLNRLGRWYNHALLGIEVNNHGYATCAAANNVNYPRLYYRHSYDERTERKSKKIGWRTQSNTKPLLVDELAGALRPHIDGSPAELGLTDEETIGELRTFVRDERGGMRGSPFDDQVISLGIANQMRKHTSTHLEEADEHAPEWSMAWWERMILDEQDGVAPEWRLGTHSSRVA